MQESAPVLFTKLSAKRGNIGLITLNRPEALNALSGEMIYALTHQLQIWNDDPEISMVLIQGAGGKAFCAGGDLKAVYSYGPSRANTGLHFYEEEYKLNLMIYNYSKPYVAILDGIAMGGGLGISLHGARAIATEKLQLAMPETAIGFFPDVGAGCFFQHCPHKIGLYLALTGNSIGVADAVYANLVDAFVPSTKIETLVSQLCAQDLTFDTLAIFDKICTELQETPGDSSLQHHANVIENCFSKNSVAGILATLNAEGTTWSKQQVAILNSRSPTSLKVTFTLMNIEQGMELKDALALEMRIAQHFMQQHDIYEGIRALLIDKTRDPKWQPATLSAVNDKDIEQLFN